MRILFVIVAVALVGGLAAESASSEGNGQPAAGTCRDAGRPEYREEHLPRPPRTVKRGDRLVAVVQTNCGRFTFGLDARRSPAIVNSFVYLARAGFFDGLSFYRVVPDFVIQGGDPSGEGSGGPGYTVVEPPPPHFRYKAGTVAMARSAAEPSGAAGSIFFVVVGQGGGIPPEYADLGQVRSGMATVRRIDSLGTAREVPTRTVLTERISIRTAG